MDGPANHHTKRSEPDRESQTSCNITYVRNLKKKIPGSLVTKQKQTHRNKKQANGYPRAKGGEER